MDTNELSNEVLLEMLIGKRAARKFYTGRLTPLMVGEGDTNPHPTLEACLEITRRMLKEEIVRGECFSSSSLTRTFLFAKFRGLPYESFICFFLDNQNRVVQVKELFRGTIDGATVHPREVVRLSLQYQAAACIFAHNHPSGVAEPSQADVGITRRLKNALGLIDVRTLDHFVVGSDAIVSLAERGLI